MNTTDIVRFRLANQLISNPRSKTPEDVVAWLASMQAQEFAMAKWALGLRLKNVHGQAIENSFNEGRIIRTHLLRPTWHFVAAKDLRWMLSLTAPRVHKVNKYYYKKFELTNTVFKRANGVLVKMLKGGKRLTRKTLNEALRKSRIKAEGLRLSYIFMQAELEGIICSGPREGKQFTYALLDERVPATKPLQADEALAELSRRYFASRGPATVQDFVWWSGLTTKEAYAGIAMLDKSFIHERIGDKTYILNHVPEKNSGKSQTTFLMPDYDEYGIGYKDRSALFKKDVETLKGSDNTSPYSHMLIVDGMISGTWKIIDEKSYDIEVKPFFRMTNAKQQAINAAIRKYRSFLTL